MECVNLTAYKFVRLDDLEPLRQQLLEFCLSRSLKGTILISGEGINVFVAGERQAVSELVVWLRMTPAFADIDFTFSHTKDRPFRRLRVKIR